MKLATPQEIAEVVFQCALKAGEIKPTERESMIEDLEKSPELLGVFQAMQVFFVQRALEAAAEVCANIPWRCDECDAHNDHEQCTTPRPEDFADAIRAMAKEVANG